MSIEDFIQEEKFYHYFQPIYNVENWNREGYEVLLRSDFFPNPESAFTAARKAKRLYELDSRSIHKALSTYQSAGLSRKAGNLFVNVFPSTISNPNFLPFLSQVVVDYGLDSQQIVFEISESEVIENLDSFKLQLNEIKKQGFLIAIDDIGIGYSNFKSIIELEPDFLKLDRYFSKDLELSKKKQKLISFFIHYCEEANVKLVLEGLENEIEVAIAKALGVPIAQGYILGRPAAL